MHQFVIVDRLSRRVVLAVLSFNITSLVLLWLGMLLLSLPTW